MDTEGVLGAAARTGKRGARAVRRRVDKAGGAVAEVARKIPYIGRATGKDGKDSEETERLMVEELSDDSLKRYMAVLIWLVHIDDRRIDERDLCEIQLMMTRMRCSARIRTAVREQLERPRSLDPRELIKGLLYDRRDAPEEAKLALKCALMKDAIRVRRATSGGSVREVADFCRLRFRDVPWNPNKCCKQWVYGTYRFQSDSSRSLDIPVIIGASFRGISP